MLKSLKITSFRGVKSCDFEGLSPLSIIVGPNGSGKTTILEAINIGVTHDLNAAIEHAAHSRPQWDDAPRWLSFRGRMTPSRVVLKFSSGIRYVDLRYDKNTPVKSTRSDAEDEASLPPLLPYPTKQSFADMKEAASKGKVTATDTTLGQSCLIDSRENSSLRSFDELHTRVFETGLQQQEFEIVRKLIPGAEAITILTSGSLPVANVVYPTHAVPVYVVGDGVERVIRLGLEALLLDKGLLILEEPEVYLHPKAIQLAAKIIVDAVQRGVQVILSTHSLELIDNLVASWECDADCSKMAVFRVLLEEGNLKVSRIPGDRVVALRSTIEDDLR
jgi:energy-coupling factor transporter ATP-binding protein EcfA2